MAPGRCVQVIILICISGVAMLSCAPGEAAIVPRSGTVRLGPDDVTEIRPVRGIWEVYPGEALTPEDFDEPRIHQFGTVPPPYGRYYAADGTRHLSGTTTYRLVIENIPSSPLLGLLPPPLPGNYRIWVRGSPVSGRVIPIYPGGDGTAELIIQAVRSYYPFGGMSNHPPLTGPLSSLNSHVMIRLFRDGVLIGALILLSLYHLLLTLGPNRDAPTLTLAGLAFFLGVHLFVACGEMAFTTLFSVSAPFYTRMMGLALYPLPPLYVRFLRSLFPLETRGRQSTIVERLLWTWMAVSFLIPLRWWMDFLYAGVVVMVGAVVLATGILVRAVRSRRSGVFLVLSGVFFLIVATILEVGRITWDLPLRGSVMGYGFVLFAGFNSLAVFLRIVDFRISLSNLKEQAQHDGLTGLYNRRTLDTRLIDEHGRHERAERPLSVIMLDVDYFKEYNDRKGHQAGDEVLKTIAMVLEAHARRSGDVAARYGGEEFALILPHTDIHGAYGLAESIRRAVLEQNIYHPSSPFGVITVSVGVTAVIPSGNPHLPSHPDSLYRAADTALYDAKKSGRNVVRSAACL